MGSSGTTVRLMLLLGATSTARAQDAPTLDVQRFDPIAQRPGFSVVRDAAPLRPWELVAVVSSSWAMGAFALQDGATVVDHLVGVDVGVALAPLPWLQLAVDLPALQATVGDAAAHDVAGALGAEVGGVGLGDLRLTAGLHLLRQGRNAPLHLALTPWFGLPTGRRELLVGSGAVQVGVDLALGGRWGRFRCSGVLGYAFLTDTEPVGDVLADDEARVALGLGVVVGPRDVAELDAEVVAATVVVADRLADLGLRPLQGRETPAELLLGVTVRPGRWFLKAGAGVGLTSGFGAPDVRVFVQIGADLRLRASEPGDVDDDGVPDPVDACLGVPEDHDGRGDDDGCPEPDDDLDRVLDVHDRCPTDPAPPGDDDGCPPVVAP